MAIDPMDDPGGGFQPVSQQEMRAQIPEFDLSNPLSVGILFLQMLSMDLVFYRQALLNVTTPESWPAWGDFSEVADMVRDLAFSTTIEHPRDGVGNIADDVAYVKLFEGFDGAFVVRGEYVIPGKIISLVWRPEYDRWMVHGVGWPLLPEELPRTGRQEA